MVARSGQLHLHMSGSSSDEIRFTPYLPPRGFDDPSGAFEPATVLEKRLKVSRPSPPLPRLRLPSEALPAVARPAPGRSAARAGNGLSWLRRLGPLAIASLAGLLLGVLLADRPTLPPVTLTAPLPTVLAPASPLPAAPSPAGPEAAARGPTRPGARPASTRAVRRRDASRSKQPRAKLRKPLRHKTRGSPR